MIYNDKTDFLCIPGLDLMRGRENGTWFGVSKHGKIGSLLNILTPYDPLPSKRGRGNMINTVFVLFNARVLLNAHPLITEMSAVVFFSRQVVKQHVTQITQRVF